MARSLHDHRYNVSEKGRKRRRRYDQQPHVRRARRLRDLAKARERALTNLAEIEKELNWQTNMLSCGRVRSLLR